MDDPDQSPLVSSSSTAAPSAAEQERWQPKQPLFQYQFVREPEEEEEEEDEEEEEEEEDDEQLEVRERKPATAPTALAAPAPPLLDLGASGEQSPTRPPPVPQPAWSSHPDMSSSSPSPPFASSPAAPEFAPLAEKEKEPPRSAPPPPPPPHREEPPAPAVPPRSAPLPPKREEPPAVAARKVAASGAPDETLFTLPVASEPLMHSSADEGMDSREQQSRVHLASQEDFAAVLLEAPASVPSLSPLSANPFKEHAALDTISDGLSARGSYDPIEIKAFKADTKNARNPFLAEDDGDAPELKHPGDVPPYTGAELFSLSQTEAAVDTKVRSDMETFPAHQQDSSPDSPVELFSKQKDSFLEDKYIDDYGDKVVVTDNHSVRDEYVDFKPFESSWASNENNGLKDSAKNQEDVKIESGIDKYDAEKGKTPSAQKDFEKESESSNEDISFPSTPAATKESSQAYITCAKLESAETVESSVAKSLSLMEEQASANKTDEKKIAEMKAHFGTEQSGTQAELASGQSQKADFDKAESLPKKSADAVANMPESLTPDLVQEAYESDLHDAVSPKLAYETQIDLVQASELLQEPLNAAVQLCPSFEGGTETAPSPVLPDIVMEAPLNASTVGVGGPAVRLEVSSSESFAAAAAADDYKNVMEKSEKPPSYQETMNVLASQVQEPKVEIVAKEPDSQNDAAREDLESSYISIACDLVKETKVSSDSASPAVAAYSKTVMTECVSQPVPEYPEHLEKVSPSPGKSDLFITQSELHLVQKEREAVKEEKPLETATKLVPEEGWKEEPEELQPPVNKPYLESFQPRLEPSKHVAAGLSPEVEAADLAKKTPQIHMEELNTYSDDFTVSKEHQMWDKSVLSAEPSPETDDFPRISYQAAESMMGATENGALKEDESREILGAVKTELRHSPYQEVAQDLSLKNIHVRIEEQDLPLEKHSEKLDREVLETAKVPPLPAEINIVSIGKEAERGVASVKEKEKLSPMFSTKLSKPSVVDLLYWRDVKKTGVVFGASLFLLLSLTVFSIVSVVAYIALALLSVTISFRIYKGVIQAIQKSDEGHPFRAYLDKDVAVSEELVQKYSHVVLGHFNSTVKELRRLFLVDDLVDSLKFAVLMWVFTYVGALFNGLTLLILALISLFSIPVIYEKHQAQIDHYLGLVNKNVKDAVAKIQAKIPGLKRKAE